MLTRSVDVRFPGQTKSERVFQENKSNRRGNAGPITCWSSQRGAGIIWKCYDMTGRAEEGEEEIYEEKGAKSQQE